jgi:hypothetical protein
MPQEQMKVNHFDDNHNWRQNFTTRHMDAGLMGISPNTDAERGLLEKVHKPGQLEMHTLSHMVR